jgi:hypothetical protein
MVTNVSNVGTQQTTITHVVMHAYPNRWRRFRKRASKKFIINHAMPAYPLPYVLQAGQTFMSMALQEEDVEKLSRDSLLYFRHHPLVRRSPSTRARSSNK